jgi:hypothetical protein
VPTLRKAMITKTIVRSLDRFAGAVVLFLVAAVWPCGTTDRTAGASSAITLHPSRGSRNVRHMEEGYTQLGTVLTDQRPEDSEGDGALVVGRFRGDAYDGVQLSYEAGRRNLYLTPEGALRLAFLLAAAVERDIEVR